MKDVTLEVDNQGGCCDNDVHEIFKCMDETVLGKAFVYENEDGSFLTYSCSVSREEGTCLHWLRYLSLPRQAAGQMLQRTF